MDRISELRKKIDRIDEVILSSLKKRVNLCRSLGEIKREKGIPIRDFQRENEEYVHVMKRAKALELNPHEVKSIYEKIIAMSVHAQETNSVGTSDNMNPPPPASWKRRKRKCCMK